MKAHLNSTSHDSPRRSLSRTNIVGRFLFGIVLLSMAGLHSARAQDDFTAMYVFGDSLSDNGNLLASGEGIGPFLAQPPFANGRVSNGPVAVEILADLLGLPALQPVASGGTNYAVAGATARGKSSIDLSVQVQSLLTATNNTLPSDALYVIIIGGNDVREARDRGPRVSRVFVNRAITNIRRNMQALIDAGARKFIIGTSPDIGDVPETRLLQAAGAAGLVSKARDLSRRFNSGISRIVKRLETENEIDIVVFDLFGFLRFVTRNGDALNLTNTTGPCFLFTETGVVFSPGCEDGSGFDSFAFFDAFHPTAFTHERAGRLMYSIAPRPGEAIAPASDAGGDPSKDGGNDDVATVVTDDKATQ